MEFRDIQGKTIVDATEMKMPYYDDNTYLRLRFSDGTECYVTAEYAAPVKLRIDDEPIDGLVNVGSEVSSITNES